MGIYKKESKQRFPKFKQSQQSHEMQVTNYANHTGELYGCVHQPYAHVIASTQLGVLYCFWLSWG